MTTGASFIASVHPRARSTKFWAIIVLAGVVLSLSATLFAANYRIGYSAEDEQSVGSAWTFMRRQTGPVPVGDYGVFAIDARVGRNFKPGTLFVKLVVGRPGDLVEVTPDGTKVNGKIVAGEMDAILTSENPDDYKKTFILGVGEYFVVGTRPRSYDSRYWGPVRLSQFVGQAWLL